MYEPTIPPIDERLAYLCGFLLGDGSIQVRKDKHDHCIKAVGNPKDEKEYYETVIKKLFLEAFNIPIKMQMMDSGTTYGFQISSKKLVAFLMSIGIPTAPKYENLKIPAIFYQDEKLLKACISGIFDTDGCISFKRQGTAVPHYPVINITSKSPSFIKEIDRIIRGQGIVTCVAINYHATDCRMKEGYSVKSTITICGHRRLQQWLQAIGTWHPKHQRKILQFGQERERTIIQKK